EKDTYSFNELCDNLKIPLSEFCKRAGITEGTLARIRKGYGARRFTVNKILDTFSKIYERELSLDNVTGIYAQAATGPQKRASRRKPSMLPEGSILAWDFAKHYSVSPVTFRDHILIGIGRGEKDKVQVSERPKPNWPSETERYLTPEQQAAALEFWKRHGVDFKIPETEKEFIG
ncbi:MAG TPA: hypothetical protein VHV10_04555, partial [Ktedonobacteraceae bacterium]|nr:hypothetical protein [Ktedonobacteraceae bacterium]